ncbi:MAG TPA: tetratricopeptide repeat protein [Candidatus Acidoferrum sp.]|nr:tetratricopeptide repeat protein [Candidatus Acidoferrum sp.]
MLRQLIGALALVLAVTGSAVAADTPAKSAPAAEVDTDLATARARIDASDWKGATDVLQKAVARDPGNADYHNLLAYSIRKGPSPNMDLVFKHYGEALRINPKHRDAHEYIGEAYLMVGNVGKAKEHLAKLDKLCFLPCGQFRDLKREIEKYEATKK